MNTEHESASPRTGEVVFVGAGPGAPDMITMRGADVIARADIVIWASSLVDPAIVAGRHGYRSFYVDDAVFARFRAAVYWLARHEDAAGQAPENMSTAVEDFMAATARDLEDRYHDGTPFRPTPDQARACRRRNQ